MSDCKELVGEFRHWYGLVFEPRPEGITRVECYDVNPTLARIGHLKIAARDEIMSGKVRTLRVQPEIAVEALGACLEALSASVAMLNALGALAEQKQDAADSVLAEHGVYAAIGRAYARSVFIWARCLGIDAYILG